MPGSGVGPIVSNGGKDEVLRKEVMSVSCKVREPTSEEASGILPWAMRSAIRFPVPCSVLVADEESSWWASTWDRVRLLWFFMTWLKSKPVSV